MLCFGLLGLGGEDGLRLDPAVPGGVCLSLLSLLMFLGLSCRDKFLSLLFLVSFTISCLFRPSWSPLLLLLSILGVLSLLSLLDDLLLW